MQERLEEAALHLARLALRETGSRNLCVAGGVALNCKMTGVLHRSGVADRLFVQPLSYDAGVALGAAMLAAEQAGDDCRFAMEHVQYGPAYDDAAIEAVLRRNGLCYRRCDDIAEAAAALVADGKVVGWFQGRMEAGPRALGGRSIIADPRTAAMSDIVNDKVKFRERWRPFALSILAEKAADYLVQAVDAPFMVMAFEVVPGREAEIAGGAACRRSHDAPADRQSRGESAVLGAHRRVPSADRRARRAQHIVQRQGRAHRVQPHRRPALLLWHRHGRAGDRQLPSREGKRTEPRVSSRSDLHAAAAVDVRERESPAREARPWKPSCPALAPVVTAPASGLASWRTGWSHSRASRAG